jgi:hypothetical protein
MKAVAVVYEMTGVMYEKTAVKGENGRRREGEKEKRKKGKKEKRRGDIDQSGVRREMRRAEVREEERKKACGGWMLDVG